VMSPDIIGKRTGNLILPRYISAGKEGK